jgi:geranylgeranyl reductase family protein
MIEQDITIVGAGPGGATAALQLNKAKIPCLLLDKVKFPRDKTCGDALSGKVTTLLNRINPEIQERLESKEYKHNIWGIRMLAPNNIAIDVPFKWNYDVENDSVPGYVASRWDFDNFLIEEVKRCSSIDFREETDVDSIEKIDGGFMIRANKGDLVVKTKLLLVANGAHSKFSREYAGIKKENNHYAAAVRAYFENVSGFQEDGFIELHFLKEYIPGYFWIFPMANNRANVGLGLRSDYVSKRRLNLKKELMEIVENHPYIKDRFKDARLVGKIKGYPLPLGSKKYKLSGDNYMLLGDAGHLVDPVTGEGVGNAMYSGWIAAEQAVECLKRDDFSAKFMNEYDIRVNRVLGVEMKLSYQLQRILAYPTIVNFFARKLDKSTKLKQMLIRMYTDVDLRKQLVHPVFWFKVLTGRIK